MATVRITDALVNSMCSSLQHVRQPQLAKLQQDRPIQAFAALYNHLVPSELKDTFSELPGRYRPQVTTRIRIGHYTYSVNGSSFIDAKEITDGASTEVYWLTSSNDSGCDNGNLRLTYGSITFLDTMEKYTNKVHYLSDAEQNMLATFMEAEKYFADIYLYVTETGKQTKELAQLLRSFPSLNKATQAMPALRAFCDRSLLNRLDERTVRTARTKEDEEDTTEKPTPPDADAISRLVMTAVSSRI